MPKTYSKDFRESVIRYISNGNSIKEAVEMFGVSHDTIWRWQKGYSGFNSRSKYKGLKICLEELQRVIEDNGDSTLHELGKRFNCSYRTIDYHLKKLGITRKKNHLIQGKKRRIKTELSA